MLSVLVVTFAMTAPMTAWMLYRGMPRRATWEMSATMPILAIILLTLGWLGVVPMGDLALLMHGLMMPVMPRSDGASPRPLRRTHAPRLRLGSRATTDRGADLRRAGEKQSAG